MKLHNTENPKHGVLRKIGALYEVKKMHPAQPEYSYPAVTPEGNPPGIYGSKIEIPYGSPVLYLGKISDTECKVIYEDRVYLVHEYYISEKPVQ